MSAPNTFVGHDPQTNSLRYLKPRGSRPSPPRPSFRSATVKFNPDSRITRWPSSTFVPSSRTTTGTLILELPRRLDNAASHHVATHDAAKDIDQNRLHVFVRQKFEMPPPLFPAMRRHLHRENLPAPAGEFDDIHCGHRQAGAIDHAGDVAIELDVVEIEI